MASICPSELIRLVASNWVRFVILPAGRSIIRSESDAIDGPVELVCAIFGGLDGRGLAPKRGSYAQRLDPLFRPPVRFIAVLMQVPMVLAAERHGEFVADFSP